MDFEVLVSIEHDGQSFGVVRDRAGATWLSDSMERICGTQLDSARPALIRLADDRALIGGLMPPRAVSAEIVDDAGERHTAAAANGAYAAVLDQLTPDGHGCPVCCRDNQGTPVAASLPADWPRTAVLDAEEPCPACGAVAWDEVRPTDGSRGHRGAPGGGMEPAPIVACRTCGYEETVGAWITFEQRQDADPEAAARARRVFEQARQQRHRAVLAEVKFPIYAAEGLTASIAGYGSSSGLVAHRVREISVAHPAKAVGPARRLVVDTSVNDGLEDSEQMLARLQLWALLHEEMPPPKVERSEAGRVIAWRSVDRKRRKLAASAHVGERLLLLDGRPRLFTFVELGKRWVAVLRLSGLTVTVSANEVDPDTLSIKPIDNPVEELLGETGG